jgi:hypothetical protein
MDLKKFAVVCIPIFLLFIWRGANIFQALVVSIGVSFFFILIFALVFESLFEPIYKWLGKK